MKLNFRCPKCRFGTDLFFVVITREGAFAECAVNHHLTPIIDLESIAAEVRER